MGIIDNDRYWDEGIILVDGCSPCSSGCDHCWSAVLAHRFDIEGEPGHENHIITINESPTFNGVVITHPERLKRFKTRKPKVFSIWNDWCNENVDHHFRHEILLAANQNPQNYYIALTKRPHVLLDFMKENPVWYQNWYNGLTVCNQQEADEKLPIFLQVPGKKFLSIEPMLSEINFPAKMAIIECPVCKDGERWTNHPQPRTCYRCGTMQVIKSRIDAILLGGETGTGARPMHPDWVRAVRNQCAAAGVPFFFKGWGEWAHETEYAFGTDPFSESSIRNAMYHVWDGGGRSYRIGKKKAGRLLDGKSYNHLPWTKV